MFIYVYGHLCLVKKRSKNVEPILEGKEGLDAGAVAVLTIDDTNFIVIPLMWIALDQD